jgi:hypothetical protein
MTNAPPYLTPAGPVQGLSSRRRSHLRGNFLYTQTVSAIGSHYTARRKYLMSWVLTPS